MAGDQSHPPCPEGRSTWKELNCRPRHVQQIEGVRLGVLQKIHPVFPSEQNEKKKMEEALFQLLFQLQPAALAIVRTKKKRPGSLLSNCPTLHESDTGPL